MKALRGLEPSPRSERHTHRRSMRFTEQWVVVWAHDRLSSMAASARSEHPHALLAGHSKSASRKC